MVRYFRIRILIARAYIAIYTNSVGIKGIKGREPDHFFGGDLGWGWGALGRYGEI